jgi:hypothetical protein
VANVAVSAFSTHRTLVAATVDRITLTDSNFGQVEVLNRDGVAEIYFTVDGADPTVGGDGTHVLPASVGAVVVRSSGRQATVVKLISSGTPKYSIRGV